MADAEKRVRTAAKASFTRAVNRVFSEIDKDEDVEVLELLYQNVERSWKRLIEKNELYLSALTEEDDSMDLWSSEVEGNYENLQITYTKWKKKKELGVIENSMASSLQLKKNEITDISRNIKDIVENKGEASSLKREQENLTYNFRSLRTDYLKLIEQSGNKNYLQDLNTLTNEVRHINTLVDEYISSLNSKRLLGSKVRMEKLPLPTFDGSVREYPRFRKEFMELVMPSLSEGEAAFTLRRCLTKVVEITLGACNENVTDMLSRLDEKYGDPRKVVDSVVAEISQYYKMKDNDKDSFIHFVDILDRAYLDLKKLELEKEMCCTSIVSLIESKLPENVSMEWYRHMYKAKIDKNNIFIPLLDFLKTERSALEYSMSKVKSQYHKPNALIASTKEPKSIKCWMHPDSDSHSIHECFTYNAKNNEEKIALIKEKGVCWVCLRTGHRSTNCLSKKVCGEEGCQLFHHKSLHAAYVSGLTFHIDTRNKLDSCILLLMNITTKCNNSVNVMWDSASTISLITFKKAKELSLVGTTVKLNITKAGGEEEEIRSCKYDVVLKDVNGTPVSITVYGITRISSVIAPLELKGEKLFSNVDYADVNRPSGEVDILIGLDYASFHPQIVESHRHLVLYQNRFGRCIGGTHPDVQEDTKRMVCQATVNHINAENIKRFFDIENIGIECTPQCGNCRCGKCPLGGKEYNIKEERELTMIEEGLVFKGSYYEAKYPWNRNPNELPDNKSLALALLFATEKRLLKNTELAKLYKDEMNDMLNRRAARKLTKAEIKHYSGPVHYLTHHEIVRMEHPTTPCRIVFNASKNFEGHVLNDYWAKGPDLLNNMVGVIIRFREEYVCINGDVKKMYHSVRISEVDQHTHRFLWRNMDLSVPPDTYVMECVSFGDKPAGTIAQLALRKTAEMSKEIYPEAWQTITKNTYMDDILDSVSSVEEAVNLAENINEVLAKGGFKVKSWTISGEKVQTENRESECKNKGINVTKAVDTASESTGLLKRFIYEDCSESSTQKVLGIVWNLDRDRISFAVKLNFASKIMKAKVNPKLRILENPERVPSFLTKRMILSQINGIFDPLGLAAPFIVKGKILMRRLWVGELKSLGWDDPIPVEELNKWRLFFKELLMMKDVQFPRCLRPKGVKLGKKPELLMFSDASEAALGCCGYIRWELEDGGYECKLVGAKNKVTPIKEMSIVRKELEAAVLSKRFMKFICKETRYEFENIYFFIDSEVVLAMINRENYGFNTYAALRIGEIQRDTRPEQWFWIDGKSNIADWVTRGRYPTEIQYGSTWQNGPSFVNLPVVDWPARQSILVLNIPEQIRTVLSIQATTTEEKASIISNIICIERFSKYLTLIGTTARVLAVFGKENCSLGNCKDDVLTDDYERAKMKWVEDCQSEFTKEDVEKKYLNLSPQRREDGVWVVGARTASWMEISYNKRNSILLPFSHRFSKLYAEFIHSISHLGVLATAAKIRLQFWIVNIQKMVKSIVYHCITCRKKRKELLEQVMSPLPLCRLLPAPAWHAISLDYCGPFVIRGEVSKRSRGKCYMVLVNCLVTRAVYVDVASSYDTNEFLKLLRRFFTLRGRPSIIYADNGTQIKAASKEMSAILKDLDWGMLMMYGAEEGTSWRFTAPDAPWQNGCAEALIKTLKGSLEHSIGDHILSFTEIQTVAFEAANLMNERPIGRHPTSPDESHYLCPNDLLLGRATSRVPQGPFKEYTNEKHRFELVQRIADGFWKKMVRSYFPSLTVQQKWHTQRRNVVVGDIVLIQDSNAIRGNWKLGRVYKVELSKDGIVRNCQIQYKPINPDSSNKRGFTTIRRPVQKLVIILPVEEDKT